MKNNKNIRRKLKKYCFIMKLKTSVYICLRFEATGCQIVGMVK